ncbi:MAG: GNAT family N-acetyltransferase [Acidobacteria bacterium]|nr:GNAT family N-acetyltransferase [Acidobacteriota bacterium]
MIAELDAAQALEWLDPLAELLRDAVESGASIGFLPPLEMDEARRYWREVAEALTAGTRALLVARVDGQLLGAVQLGLETRPNGAHRAEVMKLMVDRRARRRGIGRALMQTAEEAARRLGRSLLVLDTRVGDAAEQLYASMGYLRAGVIPRYAADGAGVRHDTVFFYKEIGLDPVPRPH